MVDIDTEKQPLSAQRSYTVIETDFLNLALQVHRADTGCEGPLTTDGASHESSAALHFSVLCLGCGAAFNRMRLGGTNSLATVLGILLAGNSLTGWSASCQYSDMKVMHNSTFYRLQKLILREVDKLFEKCIKDNNDALHANPARRIRVPIQHHYILNNKTHLLARMEGDFGLKVGAVAIPRTIDWRVRVLHVCPFVHVCDKSGMPVIACAHAARSFIEFSTLHVALVLGHSGI